MSNEFAITIAAALARDLDAAGLLSEATRKAIHSQMGELRSACGGNRGGDSDHLGAAVAILETIPVSADG